MQKYMLALGIMVSIALALPACGLLELIPTPVPQQPATPTPTPVSSGYTSYFLDDSTPFPTLEGTTPVSPESATEISAEGGAVLQIPKGSFDQETAIKVTRVADSPLPSATASITLVADVYEIEMPTAADFTQPVTLSIPFSLDDLPSTEESDLHALTIVWWDGEAWREVPSTVDLAAGVVSGQLDHFSLFSAGWSKFKNLAYDATGAIRSLHYDGEYTQGAFTIHYATRVTLGTSVDSGTPVKWKSRLPTMFSASSSKTRAAGNAQ